MSCTVEMYRTVYINAYKSSDSFAKPRLEYERGLLTDCRVFLFSRCHLEFILFFFHSQLFRFFVFSFFSEFFILKTFLKVFSNVFSLVS